MIDKIEKINLLIAKFFSKFSKTNLIDMKKYEYLKKIEFNILIDHEIENAIKDVSNNKFSKNDEIINRVLILLIDSINLLLMFRKFFQTYLNNYYCFEHFKTLITM